MTIHRQGYTWEPIPSRLGYYVCREGLIASDKRRGLKVMSPIRSKDGHKYVFIYRHGRAVKKWVHQLVLLTFCRPARKDEECRHLDGDPANNALENLVWGTRQENADDRVRHGRSPQGERSGSHKLTETDVIDIRRRRCSETSRELGQEYGVSHTTILSAASGHHWRHVK